jgi:hypothetical protein
MRCSVYDPIRFSNAGDATEFVTLVSTDWVIVVRTMLRLDVVLVYPSSVRAPLRFARHLYCQSEHPIVRKMLRLDCAGLLL